MVNRIANFTDEIESMPGYGLKEQRLFLWFAGLFRLGLFLSWMFPFSFFLLDGNAFLTCEVHICLILHEVIVLK